MIAQNPAERIQALEDDVQGLDSALDARTRRLWAEVITIKVMLAELQERMREAEKCRA